MIPLIVLIILILLNALFSAMEMAYISLNDAKINKMAKSGNKKAAKVSKTLKYPSKFLATIQIGNTLAGFLSSAFAADAFAYKLAPTLQELLPVISLEAWKTISIILITIILSYFTILFGELVPKRIAMKYHEKIAFASVRINENNIYTNKTACNIIKLFYKYSIKTFWGFRTRRRNCDRRRNKNDGRCRTRKRCN